MLINMFVSRSLKGGDLSQLCTMTSFEREIILVKHRMGLLERLADYSGSWKISCDGDCNPKGTSMFGFYHFLLFFSSPDSFKQP